MPLSGRWSWVPISDNVARAEAYLPTKWHPDPSSPLATHGPKSGGTVLRLGGPGFPSNTMSWGADVYLPTKWQGILIHPAVWPQQKNRRKLGRSGCVPLGGGSPSNTMWPGPRPTSIPSGILISAAVWPQYMGHNWRWCRASFLGGAGSSSNTMLPGPSSTSIPSGILILIHRAVSPQQT